MINKILTLFNRKIDVFYHNLEIIHKAKKWFVTRENSDRIS